MINRIRAYIMADQKRMVALNALIGAGVTVAMGSLLGLWTVFVFFGSWELSASQRFGLSGRATARLAGALIGSLIAISFHLAR